MKFTFKTELLNSEFEPPLRITVETDAVQLDDILVHFKDFLCGCGFVIHPEARLEIIEPFDPKKFENTEDE